MKKIFLSLLLVCVCFIPVYSDFLLPLNSDNPVTEGEISDPCIVKLSDSDLFFFYIKNGSLEVLKSADSGNSFHTVDITETGITNVEKISLHSGVNNRPFLLIQAVINGRYGIYVLTFNENGQLTSFFNDSLTVDTLDGTITSYKFMPVNQAHFLLLYIKEFRLCVTWFSLLHNSIDKNIISTERYTITDYNVFIHFDSDDLINYGLYFTEDNGITQIHYFELLNKAITRNEVIYEHQASIDIPYELFKTAGNETVFHYINGTDIYGKRLIAGTWCAANNGEPVTDLSPANLIIPFYKEIPKEKILTGFYVTYENNDLYLVERDENNGIKPLPSNIKINNSPLSGIPAVLPVIEETLLTAILEPVDGRNIVSLAIKNENGITAIPCPGQVTGIEEIADFSFNIVNKNKLILYEKLFSENSAILQFYELCDIETGFSKKSTMSFPESEGVICDVKIEENICFVFFSDKTLLIDMNSWMSEIITSLDFLFVKNNCAKNNYLVISYGGYNFLYLI